MCTLLEKEGDHFRVALSRRLHQRRPAAAIGAVHRRSRFDHLLDLLLIALHGGLK